MPDVSLESIARIGDDVVYREVEGEAVLLNLASGTYFGLDEVGTRIWQLIEQYGALTAVLDRVVSEFDVSAAEAATDLVDLVRQLAAHGLVELEG